MSSSKRRLLPSEEKENENNNDAAMKKTKKMLDEQQKIRLEIIEEFRKLILEVPVDMLGKSFLDHSINFKFPCLFVL
jgi:hypothetical protein